MSTDLGPRDGAGRPRGAGHSEPDAPGELDDAFGAEAGPLPEDPFVDDLFGGDFLSDDRLPDGFLSGAGVPDDVRLGEGSTGARSSGNGGSDGSIGVVRRPPAARSRRTTLRAWAVVGVVVVAIGLLLARGLGSALQYYRPVAQAVADRAKLGTSDFRIEGTVVKGTIRPFPGGVDFSIRGGGVTLPVVNHGSAAEEFGGGIAVVLIGHFSRSGREFISDRIMVKHSASYLPATSKTSAGTGGAAGS